jgi:hypothetical protein
MAGKVTSYEVKTDATTKPQTLHGIREVRMFVYTATYRGPDKRIRSEDFLAVEVDPEKHDLRIFPPGTMEKLGVAPAWLKPQLEEQVYGIKPPEPKRPDGRKVQRTTAKVVMDKAVG